MWPKAADSPVVLKFRLFSNSRLRSQESGQGLRAQQSGQQPQSHFPAKASANTRSMQQPICSPSTNLLPTIGLVISVIQLSVTPMTLSTLPNPRVREERMTWEVTKAFPSSKVQKAWRCGCSKLVKKMEGNYMFTFSDKSGKAAVPWHRMRFPPYFLIPRLR